MSGLSHIDDDGRVRMVHVGDKPITARLARAESFVTLQPETLQAMTTNNITKGNVFEVARLAGIMAAKRTDELIPLCHGLPLDGVGITFETSSPGTVPAHVRIEAAVSTQARTGVEMEAMTAVAIAGLTIYDMCKAIDRTIVLGPSRLLEKSGGRSGHFVADGPMRPHDSEREIG